MTVIYSPRQIALICKTCGGSGFKLKSLSPVAFKPCWNCKGKRGKLLAKKEANE